LFARDVFADLSLPHWQIQTATAEDIIAERFADTPSREGRIPKASWGQERVSRPQDRDALTNRQLAAVLRRGGDRACPAAFSRLPRPARTPRQQPARTR
jgi:hypothetical protein